MQLSPLLRGTLILAPVLTSLTSRGPSIKPLSPPPQGPTSGVWTVHSARQAWGEAAGRTPVLSGSEGE